MQEPDCTVYILALARISEAEFLVLAIVSMLLNWNHLCVCNSFLVLAASAFSKEDVSLRFLFFLTPPLCVVFSQGVHTSEHVATADSFPASST